MGRILLLMPQLQMHFLIHTLCNIGIILDFCYVKPICITYSHISMFIEICLKDGLGVMPREPDI